MFLKKLWNNKFLILFIVILIVLLAPMLNMSRYAHMAADDFVYGADTHAVYKSTGSVMQTIKEAFPITRWWYINWQGSYTSMFLMILQPGIFSLSAYRLGLIAIFLLSLFAPVLLGYLANKYYLKMPWSYMAIILCSILFLQTQYLPSPFEGLYWYNSAIYYTFTFSIVLLNISFIILLQNFKKIVGRIINFIILLIGLIMIGGSNYPAVLTFAVGYSAFVLYTIIKKKDNRWFYVAGLAILLAAFFINVSSPGNFLRMGNYARLSLVKVAIGSIGECATELIGWIYKSPVTAFFIIGIMFAPKIVEKAKIKFVNPWIAAIIFLLLLLSQYVPSMFAISNKGPLRAENIRYMMFIIFMSIFLINICGWFYREKPEKKSQLHIPKTVGIFIVLIAFSLSLTNVPMIKLWGYKAMLYTLQNDINRFDTEMTKRIVSLEQEDKYLVDFNKEYCINDMLRPREDMWWNEVDEFYRGEPFTKK